MTMTKGDDGIRPPGVLRTADLISIRVVNDRE
jgi:hypothetical protein